MLRCRDSDFVNVGFKPFALLDTKGGDLRSAHNASAESEDGRLVYRRQYRAVLCAAAALRGNPIRSHYPPRNDEPTKLVEFPS
jgi:hypothetical protein